MKYSLKKLQSLPTLHQGQTDDLKIETNRECVWLSRLTIADGMPYNNEVTIEQRNPAGEWRTVEQYEAK